MGACIFLRMRVSFATDVGRKAKGVGEGMARKGGGRDGKRAESRKRGGRAWCHKGHEGGKEREVTRVYLGRASQERGQRWEGRGDASIERFP